MDDFFCHCGADSCRGIIRGTDYRESFVERYGEHVSDYVRRKRLSESPANAQEEIYQ
jgi:hypothetical protein